MFPDARQRTLTGIIQEKIVPDSIVYSDSYTVYDVLDVSSFKHFRINHSRILPTGAITSIALNISANQAKRHMRKSGGIPREQIPLFLKECE